MNREGMIRASTTTDRYSFLEEALSFYKYVMENCTNSLGDYQVRYLFVRHLQLLMRWAIWADCDKLIYDLPEDTRSRDAIYYWLLDNDFKMDIIDSIAIIDLRYDD